MMNNQLKSVSVIMMLVSVLLLGCKSGDTISQSNYSNTNSIANILVVKPQSSNSSKVCGKMLEVKYNGEDLKTFFMSQPMPEMWIVERNGKEGEINCNTERLNLSEEAKNILQKHWKDRLEYNYLEDFSPENGMEGVRRDTKLSKSFIETERSLEQTLLNKDKARNLTSTESEELLIFLRDSANAIFKTFKAQKTSR